MADPAPRLTVVIPAFNEQRRLGATLEKVYAWLRGRGESFEILVVDDGSTDDTVALARAFAAEHAAGDAAGRAEVVTLGRNRGKGAAVREGFRRSRGDIVVFSDADLSTPIEELEGMTEGLRDGWDLVMASRDLPESNLAVRQAWYRENMGKLFNRIVRLITGIPFRDTQCGFKLMRGEPAREIAVDMREEGFAFDVELILLARGHGYRVCEFPVTWRHVNDSRVAPVKDALRMLRALPRIVGRTGRYQ